MMIDFTAVEVSTESQGHFLSSLTNIIIVFTRTLHFIVWLGCLGAEGEFLEFGVNG